MYDPPGDRRRREPAMERALNRAMTALALAAVLLVPFGASACAGIEPRQAAAVERTPADYGAKSILVIHYHRPDGDYEGWNVWGWRFGADGGSYAFTERDAFGAVAVLAFDEVVDRAGFILRLREWEAKDTDQDRFVEIGDDGVAEVWLVAGNPTVYDGPDLADLTLRVSGAFLDGDDRVTLTATAGVPSEMLEGLRVETEEGSAYRVKDVSVRTGVSVVGVAYTVELAEPVADADIAKLWLKLPGEAPQRVFARGVLEDARFEALDAELGNQYSPSGTRFAAWSPVASSAELLLFEDGCGNEATRVVEMARGGGGVWTARVGGDLDGVAYRYRFVSYGSERVVPDVYAYGASCESSASVVLDLDATDPDGWGDVEPPARAQQTDEVIYEIHVRDFSIADPNCPPGLRGTYLGLIQGSREGGVSTGIEHLKDLGVTAVHLLPIQDYPGGRDSYNWGYWTGLFNVPEGNYATEGAGPAGSIRELKEAIKGLQEAGIRVILDVVYNHTSSSFEASAFDQTVPWYYFRTTADGRLSNDAGVGNSVADERAMARKYIVDSLLFWLDEYRVDGFRFDLLGTHEPETVRAICDAVLAVRPDATLYGEPWTGGGPIRFGKGAQRGMAMAVFNDHLRNAIRGDLDGDATGFATGPDGDVGSIRAGVMGAIDDFADDPSEVITYVSAHDNLTLWDKIEKVAGDADERTKRDMQKLALGVVLTSQGAAFLHGGSDFCRTKGGNHNSYNAGDEVNKFDWGRKADYLDVHAYVAGLIELRRAHPVFRMAEAADVRESVAMLPTRGELVAFTLDGSASGDSWATTLVVYNGGPRIMTWGSVPDGEWAVVVDAERAGVDVLRRVRGEVTLPAYSMMVLRRE